MEKKEKHLVHALADSAQLRAQLCALDSVNRQHQSSDMEALQMDLVKALERATSSEAEVERYNKEIRKLRERLKSTEDEAGRLDSELKATVSFLQKERDGVTKENQVLLEQLARKDEEVLAQAEEINTLKSMLACLRVSQLELERLKNELQGPRVQRMKNASLETIASGNRVLQSQAELKNESSEVQKYLSFDVRRHNFCLVTRRGEWNVKSGADGYKANDGIVGFDVYMYMPLGRFCSLMTDTEMLGVNLCSLLQTVAAVGHNGSAAYQFNDYYSTSSY
ncbi:hypothetical protein L7F22_067574 [Adiantum nelumboides]|nr:hypothetical protein [Adiantum nelumboides]